MPRGAQMARYGAGRKIRLVITAAVLAVGAALSGSRISIAQQADSPIDAAMARWRQMEAADGNGLVHLSASARNLLTLARRWPRLHARALAAANTGAPAPPIQSALSLGTDLQRSRYSGFTQSETATAWCGPNVVMAFNDTAAEVVSIAAGRGISMDGYARSADRGNTFAYMGSPTTPDDPNTFMSGDPMVACTDAETFYYVSSYLDGTNGISGVSLSKSVNGGASFAPPVAIAALPSTSHLVSGAWIAVDPSAPARLYASFADFDFSGSICGIQSGSPVPRYAIEIVSSADAGSTWSLPVAVAQVCADAEHEFAFVSGARSAIGPGGDVYVAWEQFGGTDPFSTRQIEIARSIDQTRTFAAPVTVANVGCAGDCADWQGLAHSNESPTLAIGKGPHSGIVYLAWNDGDRPLPDALTTTGSYNFTDIKFSKSADNGATWSSPVRVNNNGEGFGTPMTDRFEPALAADISGRIAICFYDRRNDPANFLIDRYCASSSNGGIWTNTRITWSSFPTMVGQDVLLAPDYMGDYDTLASDTLNHHSGFVGGFASNKSGNPVIRTYLY